MHPQGDPSPHHHLDERHPEHEKPSPRRWHGALAASPYLAGLAALAWLVLRSGSKPSRWTYPCQQAAFSAASLAFGAPLVAAVVGMRRWMNPHVSLSRTIVLAVLGLALTLGIRDHLSAAAPRLEQAMAPDPGPLLAPAAEYRAKLFHETSCAPDPVGDRFPGLDSCSRSWAPGDEVLPVRPDVPAAGPMGSSRPRRGRDQDQLPVAERGGTNTDVLRGLIRRISIIPTTFTGEVVVVRELAVQLDRRIRPCRQQRPGPRAVAARRGGRLPGPGPRVSHFDWTACVRRRSREYSRGRPADGYVVGDLRPALLRPDLLPQVPDQLRDLDQPEVRDLGPGRQRATTAAT